MQKVLRPEVSDVPPTEAGGALIDGQTTEAPPNPRSDGSLQGGEQVPPRADLPNDGLSQLRG